MIPRPSSSRVFAFIIWMLTILTWFTVRVLEQGSILLSTVKAAGYMGTCIVTTALFELIVLGPAPKDDDDE